MSHLHTSNRAPRAALVSRRQALVGLTGAFVGLVVACGPAAPTPSKPADTKPADTKPAESKPAAPAATSAPAAAAPPQTAPSKPVQKLVWPLPQKTLSPLYQNILVGQQLGFYKEEGLDVEFSATGIGGNADAEAVRKGEQLFGIGAPATVFGFLTQGHAYPMQQFYEYTYPFKWDWAVLPDSQVTEISQLKGLKLGFATFGSVEQKIGSVMLKAAGVNPEADVSWTAVGEGVTGHIAMTRGDIEAMIYYDTGFGAWDVSGLKYRLLPRPDGLPQVGGFFVHALPSTLKEKRDIVIALGRTIARASVFTLENPKASVEAFIKMVPEAAVASKSHEENVRDLGLILAKRMVLWKSPRPSVTKWGEMSVEEWQDEVTFWDAGDKVKDVTALFTNELIDEFNKFDSEAVKKLARSM